MGELGTAVPDLQLCIVQQQMGRRKLVFPHDVGQLEMHREGGGTQKRGQFSWNLKVKSSKNPEDSLCWCPELSETSQSLNGATPPQTHICSCVCGNKLGNKATGFHFLPAS